MFRADPTSFPQYADEIACPMFLDLLQQRLEHGYYRTIDVRALYRCRDFSTVTFILWATQHLRHEINLIRANYVMFNTGEDTSNVDRLCKRLHSLVDGNWPFTSFRCIFQPVHTRTTVTLIISSMQSLALHSSTLLMYSSSLRACAESIQQGLDG